MTVDEQFQHLLESIIDRAQYNGMNIKELAKKAGCSPASISRLRTKGKGNINTVFLIANAAGLTLNTVPIASIDEPTEINKDNFYQ